MTPEEISTKAQELTKEVHRMIMAKGENPRDAAVYMAAIFGDAAGKAMAGVAIGNLQHKTIEESEKALIECVTASFREYSKHAQKMLKVFQSMKRD